MAGRFDAVVSGLALNVVPDPRRAVAEFARVATSGGIWSPFLGGQGPAPRYVMSLTDEHRRALRDLLRVRLPSGMDGSIQLTARAWAVRGWCEMSHPAAFGLGVDSIRAIVRPGRVLAAPSDLSAINRTFVRKSLDPTSRSA